MRKLFIGLGIVVVLLVAAVFILPSLVPASVYKDKITQQVSSTLGREVVIAGDVKLSVLPSIRAKAADVKIANADGFSAPSFAQMDTLEAKVKFWPLLKKQVEITQFTLVNPVISLEKTKDGEVNWNFGDETTKSKPDPKNNTPFARDGRYTDIQVALGKFSLQNGAVKYTDATKGTNYDLKAVNMELSMPGIDKPIKANGDLVLNDVPFDISMSLDTPKAFLNGEAAPVNVKLKSALASLSANGRFTPSKAITFDLDFDADIPSTSKLDKFLSLDNPYVALTEAASIKGKLAFDGTNLTGKSTQIALKSDILTTHFNGDFSALGTTSAAGDLKVNVADIQKLQDALDMEIPQLAAFNTVDLSANLTTDGKATNGKNVNINIKGDGIAASYTGAATFDKALSLNGKFQANSPSIPALLPKLGVAPISGISVLGDLAVGGNINGVVDALNISNLDFKTKGGDVVASYVGDVKLGEAMQINGQFDASGASVPAIVAKLGLAQDVMTKLKPANALGDFKLSGRVSGAPAAAKLSDLNFKTNGTNLTASYTGGLNLGKTSSINGVFDIASPSVKTLAQTGGITLPYSDALGALKANGTVGGTLDALNISGIKAALTGGMLNVDFDGKLQTGKALSYDGMVNVDIPSVRTLAQVGGTKLGPDTKEGAIYGPFSISGQAKGNTSQAAFTNAKIKLDAINGAGNVTALLKGKPNISGKLDLQGLDIRPYQASMYANRPKGVQPWSEEPLNLGALKMFDGTFTLNTPNIITTTVSMGQSTIKTTVKNGVLKTNIPNVSLYGGKGALNLELNGSKSIPLVAMDFDLNNVDGKGLLGAVANFTKLSGNTGTTLKVSGAGRSQAEIMRSLSGNGNFELAEGVISGVNIGEFVSNINDLSSVLQARSLPAGIGPSYTTPFSKLDGLFSIKNGVVTVGDFALKGNNVLAEGAGTLDLGKQRVDFSLRPRLENGKGLAAFGIPIKLSGNFGGVKAGLDTDLMSKIVAAHAKAKLQDQITKKIGGNLGGDLGGIVGGVLGNSQPATGSGSGSGQPTDALGGLLGGILDEPNQTQNPAATQKTEEPKKDDKKEEKKKEDPLDKALKDLFGGN